MPIDMSDYQKLLITILVANLKRKFFLIFFLKTTTYFLYISNIHIKTWYTNNTYTSAYLSKKWLWKSEFFFYCSSLLESCCKIDHWNRTFVNNLYSLKVLYLQQSNIIVIRNVRNHIGDICTMWTFLSTTNESEIFFFTDGTKWRKIFRCVVAVSTF